MNEVQEYLGKTARLFVVPARFNSQHLLVVSPFAQEGGSAEPVGSELDAIFAHIKPCI